MCKRDPNWSHQVNLKIGTRRPFECIDRCIAPIIQALNDGGIPTVASCCGHDNRPGIISLASGWELLIAKDHVTARAIDKAFPDIHGNVLEVNASQ